jgi:hypothetical protein
MVAGKVKIDKEVREIFPVESEVRVKRGGDKNLPGQNSVTTAQLVDISRIILQH